jgi:phosphatidylinositol alpha-mannosyltransferase
MKVAMVCPYGLDRFGGVQNQVLELVREIRAFGDEALLIAPGATEGVNLGESVTMKGNRSTVPMRLDPRVRKHIADAVVDADVVHLHEPFIPAVGWATIGVNRPLVGTFHADRPAWAQRLYQLIPDRFWRRRVLTAVSKVAAALPWPDVRVIPNGLRLTSFRTGSQRHRQRVVFVGRDDPRKGLPVLLEAWKEVHSAVPGAELIVIGPDGTDRTNIRFVGRGTDETKASWLQSSAVLVAPNLGGESFGMVVAEGMAAGCAVVASDLPAFREVTAGTARLFPVGESRLLAAALIDVLLNQVQADGMGKRARERSKVFDWSVVFPLYRQAYLDASARFGEAR